MMSPLPSPEKLLQVEFWDHMKNGPSACRCRVWGEVIDENDLEIVLRCWTTYGSDGVPDRDNEERFSILKSTITKRRRLYVK